MSTLYDPEKIRVLAATGDKFYQGAWWVLRQQEAAQLTGHRAAFMSDKISMDEARVKASIERSAAAQAVLDSISAEDWDNESSPAPPSASRKRL